MKHRVIRQDWIERERGWGFRPDGYTLHLTSEDHHAFIKDYWDGLPDTVPSIYSSPEIKPGTVEVDEKTYRDLQKQKKSKKPRGVSRHGLWY